MNISPDTLLEESDWERRERQRRTGVIGNGLTVTCHPSLEDRMIVQQQHRAVCLRRPHEACSICPHSSFTLIFTRNTDRYDLVACPRWLTPGARCRGESPDHYTMVEVGTCKEKPFDFCPTCPDSETVLEFAADKVRPGWYTRWRRLSKETEEE